MAWTLPKTWTATVVSVADMNTHVRDNLNAATHEIQAVTGTQVAIPANAMAGADGVLTTILSFSAVTFDGSTSIVIEFQTNSIDKVGATGSQVVGVYEASTEVDKLFYVEAVGWFPAGAATVRLTPSAASHTYLIRGQRIAGGGTGDGGFVGALTGNVNRARMLHVLK